MKTLIELAEVWTNLSSLYSSICSGKLIISKEGTVEAAVVTLLKKTPHGVKHFHNCILGNARNISLPALENDSIFSPTGRLVAQFVRDISNSCLSDDQSLKESRNLYKGIVIHSVLSSPNNPVGYLSTIPIPEKLHGCLMTREFGCPRFDPKEERYILYSADSLGERSKGVFQNSNGVGVDSCAIKMEGRFQFRHTFGEHHTNQSLGQLYIADVKTKLIKPIEWPNTNESFGQPYWIPDGSGFVVTAWRIDTPYRLGTAACQNRVSTIFFCVFDMDLEKFFEKKKDVISKIQLKSIKKAAIKLEDDLQNPIESCHSPVICWNSQNSKEPYNLACCAVSSKNRGVHWSSIQPVVSILSDSDLTLYGSMKISMTGEISNPLFQWIPLSSTVLLVEVVMAYPPRIEFVLLKINENKRFDVPIMIEREGMDSFNLRLLDAVTITENTAIVLLTMSDLTTPQRAGAFYLNFIDKKPHLKKIDQFQPKQWISRAPLSWCWEDNRHILISPATNNSNNTLNQLICFIHGGPHSVTMGEFSLPFVYLASLGYHILCINYRGSLGFSEDELLSLPGQIGRQDVDDCIRAIQKVLSKMNTLHQGLFRNTVFVCGGSHGGFLALHLAGQAPELVASVSTRNPVTNLIANLSASDIPDWNLYEGARTLLAFNEPFHPLSPELLSTLYDASPIRYAKAVKSPILIALGEDDRRVPPFQGLEYYRTLISVSGDQVKHRILCYPKNGHGLAHPEAEADYWVQTALWYQNSFDDDKSERI